MHAPRQFTQELIGQLGNNHDGHSRPDGLDILKGLDGAIKEHAKSTSDLGVAIITHAKSTSELRQSVDGFNSALIITGAIALVLGFLIGYVVGTGPKRQP